MAKDAEDKERIKAERLREALRANLRRRKAKPAVAAAEDNEAAPLIEKTAPRHEYRRCTACDSRE